jgi:1,4-dihydroxy-2-naphthoyl-CoA synthase
MKFEDILYAVRNGVAWIVINRPEKIFAPAAISRR